MMIFLETMFVQNVVFEAQLNRVQDGEIHQNKSQHVDPVEKNQIAI
jgi:hypothetical protein